MSDFWKKIISMLMPVIISILEKLLDVDIDGDGNC